MQPRRAPPKLPRWHKLPATNMAVEKTAILTDTITVKTSRKPGIIATTITTMQKEDAGTTEAATAPMRKGSSAPA